MGHAQSAARGRRQCRGLMSFPAGGNTVPSNIPPAKHTSAPRCARGSGSNGVRPHGPSNQTIADPEPGAQRRADCSHHGPCVASRPLATLGVGQTGCVATGRPGSNGVRGDGPCDQTIVDQDLERKGVRPHGPSNQTIADPEPRASRGADCRLRRLGLGTSAQGQRRRSPLDSTRDSS